MLGQMSGKRIQSVNLFFNEVIQLLFQLMSVSENCRWMTSWDYRS